MDTMLLIWLIALIVCIIVELATMGLTTVWFAGGALVAAILAAVNVPVAVQVAVFLVISILMMVFTRPVAVKYFNKDRLKTNVESMVGNQAVVLSEVDNLNGAGSVQVNGQEWSARSYKDDVIIPVGDVVVVKEVSGVKLIVKPK